MSIDGIREVVTWESIAGKFLEKFTEIAIDEYWATVKELPISVLYKKHSEQDMARYKDIRAEMRRHGWRQSYLTRAGKLKFMVMYDPKTSKYITLSEHISHRQADDLTRYADEWDTQQEEAEKAVAGMARHYRVRKDDVFVKESI